MTTDITDDDARGGTAATAADARGSGTEAGRVTETAPPGFLRRYRLPIALGVIALCLYAGSIIYILYGRGQIA